MRDARRTTPRERPASSGRRAMLRSLGALAAACAGVPLAGSGCRRDAPPGDDVVLPLADLGAGGRAIVAWRERPVEVSRAGDGAVTARSLVCTHMSCVVRWSADRGRYECPCHDGVFDADGRPVAGPPRRPLETVPAVVEGDRVRIGEGAAPG